MADIKWIKIYVDMFDHKKIKFIRKLPEGNDILLCWVMLLASAGKCNMGGHIFLTADIPYTAEMLADEFGMATNTVRLALETFNKLKMVNLDNGIFVEGWEEYQNIDGMERIRMQNRERAKKHYDKKKNNLLEEKPNVRTNVRLTQPNATEVEVDIDLEKEVDKEVKSSSRPPLKNPENVYQNNIGLLTEHIAERIQHLLKEGITEELLCKYITVAVERNKRNWRYIESMALGNLGENIKNLEQYEAMCSYRNSSTNNTTTNNEDPFVKYGKEKGWI